MLALLEGVKGVLALLWPLALCISKAQIFIITRTDDIRQWSLHIIITLLCFESA